MSQYGTKATPEEHQIEHIVRCGVRFNDYTKGYECLCGDMKWDVRWVELNRYDSPVAAAIRAKTQPRRPVAKPTRPPCRNPDEAWVFDTTHPELKP